MQTLLGSLSDRDLRVSDHALDKIPSGGDITGGFSMYSCSYISTRKSHRYISIDELGDNLDSEQLRGHCKEKPIFES